jgi:hypothetical protein
MAQTTTRVHIGNVLPTSTTLTTAMTNAVTAAKPQFAHLNGSNIEFMLTGVNASILPISDNVRILLADSRMKKKKKKRKNHKNLFFFSHFSCRGLEHRCDREHQQPCDDCHQHSLQHAAGQTLTPAPLSHGARRVERGARCWSTSRSEFGQSRVVVHLRERRRLAPANVVDAAHASRRADDHQLCARSRCRRRRRSPPLALLLLPAQAATIVGSRRQADQRRRLPLCSATTSPCSSASSPPPPRSTSPARPTSGSSPPPRQSLTSTRSPRAPSSAASSRSATLPPSRSSPTTPSSPPPARSTPRTSRSTTPTLIAQALAAVRFNGQSGAVAFDATTQDRPAQYNIDNVQGGAARQRRLVHRAGAVHAQRTAVLFSTGERVTPVYPFVSCASLHSCADCTCSPSASGAARRRPARSTAPAPASAAGADAHQPGLLPRRVRARRAAPSFCLYPANLTIWSTQKPRCDALNKPLGAARLPRARAAEQLHGGVGARAPVPAAAAAHLVLGLVPAVLDRTAPRRRCRSASRSAIRSSTPSARSPRRRAPPTAARSPSSADPTRRRARARH